MEVMEQFDPQLATPLLSSHISELLAAPLVRQGGSYVHPSLLRLTEERRQQGLKAVLAWILNTLGRCCFTVYKAFNCKETKM